MSLSHIKEILNEFVAQIEEQNKKLQRQHIIIGNIEDPVKILNNINDAVLDLKRQMENYSNEHSSCSSEAEDDQSCNVKYAPGYDAKKLEKLLCLLTYPNMGWYKINIDTLRMVQNSNKYEYYERFAAPCGQKNLLFDVVDMLTSYHRAQENKQS